MLKPIYKPFRLGGLLITKFGWRVCFGINIPGNFIAFVVAAFCMQMTVINPDEALPLRTKLARLDIPGTLMVIPSVVCLIVALQSGGVKYRWNDSDIVALLVAFGVLFLAFAGWQYYQGDKATIPPRIIKNRSIIGQSRLCSFTPLLSSHMCSAWVKLSLTNATNLLRHHMVQRVY